MFPHLPADHVYREVGLYLDLATVILTGAVAYLLHRLLRG